MTSLVPPEIGPLVREIEEIVGGLQTTATSSQDELIEVGTQVSVVEHQEQGFSDAKQRKQ
mgnify:CR=1 FL=1